MRDLFRTVIRKFDCLIIKKRKRLANDFRDPCEARKFCF